MFNHIFNTFFFSQGITLLAKSTNTPQKTNIKPENGPREKESPFGKHHFQVPAVSLFPGV